MWSLTGYMYDSEEVCGGIARMLDSAMWRRGRGWRCIRKMLSLLRPSRGRCASVLGGRARAAGDCSRKSDALTPKLFPASSIYYSLTRIAFDTLVCSIATRHHVVAPALPYSAARPLYTRPALTLPPEATPTPRRARPRCQSCLPVPVTLCPCSMGLCLS